MKCSIIIPVEEQEEELRQLLPRLLQMEYGDEYEVIVVDKRHDKDLKEWLQDMEARYPHLSHTFCSTTSRGIDTNRLALTLGAKAANFDWTVILPVSVALQREDWLTELMSATKGEADVAVGIVGRSGWGWFRSCLFRRRFRLFRPSPHIVLCRRSLLLGGNVSAAGAGRHRKQKMEIIKL